ncbi:MAG: prepilin-type N-terminal cleavage/methylation domain-containing protein, partial [Gammaproteobacteria bacterium]|nr:prepilin-type N-terminal cleavage/methylation domain-containing protein [Gammaproteobacteria bacterium]
MSINDRGFTLIEIVMV